MRHNRAKGTCVVYRRAEMKVFFKKLKFVLNNVFSSRKYSMGYIKNGGKPSLWSWYIKRNVGLITKDNLGKYIYLSPYWVWAINDESIIWDGE
jgi:hypothetical protein